MEGLFINTITSVEDGDGVTPIETVYDIEAKRMSQGNVGTPKKPVYFADGIPTPCDDDISGGGGNNVIITPDAEISSRSRNEKTQIATFQIDDGPVQKLYIPKVSSGYQKQVLFTGQLGSSTGDGGAPLAAPFTNFDYLYIYVEDTKNIVGTKVTIVPSSILSEKLQAGNAIVACNLYSTLGMTLRFTSPTGFKVEYINNLPNYDSAVSEDSQVSVICTKIEGVTLGISAGSWGKNTRETIWSGQESTVDPTTKFSFSEDEEHNIKRFTDYDILYIYGHISNEDEEHIDIGPVDFLINKLSSDKAIFTCGSLQDITKTLKFAEDGFYIIAGNNVSSLTYIITQIDGIKFGAEIRDGSGGVDTFADLIDVSLNDLTNGQTIKYDSISRKWINTNSGIDYVTAGQQEGVPIGTRATAEGYQVVSNNEYTHAEGFNTSAIQTASHAEGIRTCAQGYASHAEGYATTAYFMTHSEGKETRARGDGAHAEGAYTTAESEGAHAEGDGTLAIAGCAHAEGTGTSATTGYIGTIYGPHAEGNHTSAHNNGHAEGWHTTASSAQQGYGAHAEGYQTLAYNNAHAEGFKTYAFASEYTGCSIHVEGYNTYGYLDVYEQPIHIEGKYNIRRDLYPYSATAGYENYCHIIGGGNPYTVGRKDIVLIDWDGNITCNSIVQGSSRKVKENIQDMTEEEANKLLQLRPVSFDYIEKEGDKNCFGLIAEEVQEVGINYPIYKGSMKSKGEECLQLDYSKFVPYLIKVIQMQEERINQLEQKIIENDKLY